MIIFVRTKNSTVELADKLEARGYAAAAINGDIQQSQRERSVNGLKNGKLDILVATDVAARGLDVPRISHVVNYDVPHDTESYVHRIGRTGRAGREGDAILFVAPREKRMLHAIEKATHKKIDRMELPSTELINDQRVEKFKLRISDALATEELGFYYQMIEQYQLEKNVPALEIAAALAYLLQGDSPFLLQNKPQKKSRDDWDKEPSPRRGRERNDRDRSQRHDHGNKDNERGQRRRERHTRDDNNSEPSKGMARYRIEVGHNHEVKPGNIVGAIANEAGLDSSEIGRINIFDDHSLVDLPEGMPKDTFNDLQKVWVSGQQLKISYAKGDKKERQADDVNKKKKKKKRAADKDKGKKRVRKPAAK